MNKHTTKKLALAAGALVAAAAVVGCASMGGAMPASAELDKIAGDMVRAGFREQAGVKVERATDIDETLRACNAADVAGKPLPAAQATAIEQANLKTIKWPADGKFLGDWKEGEKIAQSGRGLTWTDNAKQANGGNCYNCHQITKEEISFGTIGPSLYHYGKLRGVANPASPESKAIVEYTWGKLWNAKAYNACSNMPRVGHSGILDEQQIRHVMALLLDPQSPVNK
ncbi:sulfur oxidation c-type cytochrome SoxX [Ramlibacter algicola]|uniref:Sulfur oxidation c-type cytochrome SoxX n=1 Tax=Ramlibacter algicola TaxID=2795217 RepID=A0A934Q014_9BURK|nr:sulfur oxidation c-type cytochrome SoxX [Ramlibacter algicola]MBK0392548.1 sulfur oxidation c-type cytochrome SoxX [Ramlibacter algicola]